MITDLGTPREALSTSYGEAFGEQVDNSGMYDRAYRATQDHFSTINTHVGPEIPSHGLHDYNNEYRHTVNWS